MCEQNHQDAAETKKKHFLFGMKEYHEMTKVMCAVSNKRMRYLEFYGSKL